MTFGSTEFTLLEIACVLLAGYAIGRLHAVRSDPRLGEQRRQHELKAGLAAVERLGTLSPQVRGKIDAHLAAGRVIDAVRDVRTALGCGLKEAKDVVDAARSARMPA